MLIILMIEVNMFVRLPHLQSDDVCETSADWLAAFHLRILPTEVFTVYTVATM